MQADPVTITRLIYIKLNDIGSLLHGVLQCGNGILRTRATSTTMCDHLNGPATHT